MHLDPAPLSVCVLGALFIAAFTPRFSLTLAAFPATFIVATIAGVPLAEVATLFPVDFFILIVGITALFAVVQANGTLDWLIDNALRLVGGRPLLFPPVIFLIGVLITSLGTLPAAAAAVIAPTTLRFAARHGISALAIVVVMYNGVIAGMFSPIAVYGASFPRLLRDAGIDLPPETSGLLLGASVLTGLIIAGIAMITIYRSRDREDRERRPSGTSISPPDDAAPTGGARAGVGVAEKAATPTEITIESRPMVRLASLGALVALVVGSLVFDLDMGYLALCLALALQLTFNVSPNDITSRVPWNIVMLVSGIMTYVALVESLGGFDRVSSALLFEGSPELSLLAICFVVGFSSFFISSIAVLTAAVPLIVPLVGAGVSPLHAIVAVGISAVVVDLNPLGLLGGILMGCAPESVRPRLFRQLLIYGTVAIVIGPLFAWATFLWL